MAAPVDKHLPERIQNFFHWFRQRHANVVALSTAIPPEFEGRSTSFIPEQYLMIGAHVDALANHWATAFKPSVTKYSHADRMQDFLHEHANSTGVFGRVCAPLLLDEIRRNYPHFLGPFSRAVGMHHDPQGPEPVRSLDDDPDLVTVQGHPALQDAALQKTVLKYRFGVVVYREIRNIWVHETVESMKVAHPLADTVFRYQNMTTFDEKMMPTRSQPLVLPIAKLLNVYAEALDSFERACVDRRINPSPSRGRG
jgi:hypothetical protein